MPLHVIGAGFGRTGTMSTKIALEQLGFDPCYHISDALRNPGHVEAWLAAVEKRPVDYHDVFKDYKATLDWPACTFYKDLMKAFPDAKVLLNVRDAEGWYASMKESVYSTYTDPPPGLSKTSTYFKYVEGVIWNGEFHGKFEDRDYAIAVFNKHIEDVKAYVPAERLLTFDVKTGWEPLCKFLGLPVPTGPFPRTNDREQLKQLVAELAAAGYPAFR